MIKHKIKDVFSADWVLADGAMGTNLFLKGLETGASPEEWNIDQSKKVGQIHDEFIEAGSQIILTHFVDSFHFTRSKSFLIYAYCTCCYSIYE